MPATAILDTISSPADLRRLPRAALNKLAGELRRFILSSVSQTGGHLSSSLGTVELTIALHYVFNTPDDRLVWDVGHQSYAHKILTGRKDAMASLRQEGGLSGFPKRSESEYDAFGVGHSSTSIAAALGMAEAARLKGESRQAVAVIGDGAMSAGMAFEALNNAGVAKANMLVVLNDNDMSISPPVGALNNILTRLMSGKTFNAARAAGKQVLGMAPPLLQLARRAEEHVKGMIAPGTLFEEFGFRYYGPIDGHDLDTLIATLSNLKKCQGPRFLHVVTHKGQGYAPAEANPTLYHGVTRFDPLQGLPKSTPPTAANNPAPLTYTAVFSRWLCAAAKRQPALIAITPAMREGSGLVEFARDFPERYFDVGIAEQHAVTFAAGLACEGMRPVVAIYSSFLQRAYDQLIHDVALQNLPVLFAVDRAGLVGADGATHNGSFDLSFCLCIPNVVLMTPADAQDLWCLLNTALRCSQPVVVRYPRGKAAGSEQLFAPDFGADATVTVGRGQVRRQGNSGVALLVFGSLLAGALTAAEELDATVVNMRFAKPLDHALLNELSGNHSHFITIEDNAVVGGAGSEVARYCRDQQLPVRVLNLGLPDTFIEHGEQSSLYQHLGLDAAGLVLSAREFINQ